MVADKMVAENIFYVPWPDYSEWNTVREQIFSENIKDTVTAYHTILMWKLKHDSVPAYIECTYSLLQVMIKEYEMTRNEESILMFNEHDLQLSYSTALIRFVNHVCSISPYKGETLYLAAKTQNIPDWIVNMRHDVAHGQDLPALDALHIAAELSLKWLLDNYWGNPETSEQKVVNTLKFDLYLNHVREIDTDTQNFFKKFFDIWEFCHEAKYKNGQLITEENKEFILNVEELLSLNIVYFNNIENEAMAELEYIISVYNQMEENGEFDPEKFYKFKHFKKLLIKCVKNIIKGNDQLKLPFIMALLETTFLLETKFEPERWQKIFCILQEVDSFSFFLEILFEMTGKGHKGAAKWVSVLSPSLKHLQRQWTVFEILKNQYYNLKTKLVKKKVQSTCTPKVPNLVILLDVFKPPVITLEMMKNILLNPEHLSMETIDQYLKLVKPPLVNLTMDMITDLVRIYKGEVGKVENTTDDKVSKMEEVEDTTDDKIFKVGSLNKMETEANLPVEEASGASDSWTKSSIAVNVWNKCALGLLPFQAKVDCSLPDNLSWEIKQSRKRYPVPLLKHFCNMKKFKK